LLDVVHKAHMRSATTAVQNVTHFVAGGSPTTRLGQHAEHIPNNFPSSARAQSPKRRANGTAGTKKSLCKSYVSPALLPPASDNGITLRSAFAVSLANAHVPARSGPTSPTSKHRDHFVAKVPEFQNLIRIGDTLTSAEIGVNANTQYKDGIVIAPRRAIPRFMNVSLGQQQASPAILLR
jgi:hypothetical protein